MIKQVLLSALYIFLLRELSYTQSFQYRHCLKEVSFYGESGEDDYIRLKEDILETDIDPPHFVMEYPVGCFSFDLGIPTDKKPVAYVSGAAPRVTAKFLTDCPNPLWIKGTVVTLGPLPDFEFPEKQVIPQNGMVKYEDANGNPLAADNVFQLGVVRYFDEFEIIWKISKDKSNWEEVGKSQNQLYVIKEYNASSPNNFKYNIPYSHTVIHTSCKEADNLSSNTEIVSEIYAHFKGLNVKRVDNQILTYWDPNDPNPGTCRWVDDLIKLGNGTCGAWQTFLNACVYIQGIDGTSVVVTPKEEITYSELYDYIQSSEFKDYFFTEVSYEPTFFLVKKWGVLSSDTHIYLGGDNENEALNAPGITGIPAQGGASASDPRSIFSTHSLAKINGNIYDPSYGTNEEQTFSNWEDNSIDAVEGKVFGLTAKPDGTPINPPEFYFWVKKTKTLGSEQLDYE